MADSCPTYTYMRTRIHTYIGLHTYMGRVASMSHIYVRDWCSIPPPLVASIRQAAVEAGVLFYWSFQIGCWLDYRQVFCVAKFLLFMCLYNVIYIHTDTATY